LSQHGSNANQPSSATGHNTHILPRVLALLALPMVLVVEVCDCCPEWLNTSSRTIFTACHGDINGFGTVEAAFDVIFDLGCSLSQVCPGFGVVEEAVFVRSLTGPDYSG
jgi:hypothetical protein